MAWFGKSKDEDEYKDDKPQRHFDDDDAGDNPSAVFRCHYCGDELGADSVFAHESTCAQNPNV